LTRRFPLIVEAVDEAAGQILHRRWSGRRVWQRWDK
jgi:hypothetical protein